MANRFERGYVAPQPTDRRTSGGVVVGPNEAPRKETNLISFAGALYNIATKETLYTVSDTDWSTTSNFLARPSGQALSRTGESELYARLGVTWGVGDGVNTFNIPDIISTYKPPFVVSKDASEYTTVGAYGSGEFLAHSHTISDGNQTSFFYIGVPGNNDQRGNVNSTPVPVALAEQQGQTDEQRPNGIRLRQYLATVDGEYELPIGYIIGHIAPMSSIATVLEDFPNLLVASGQSIDPTQYPTYASVYGSNIPNLQGRMIRNEIQDINIPSNNSTQTFGPQYAYHTHNFNAPPGRLSLRDSYSQAQRARNPAPAPEAATLSGAYFGDDLRSNNYSLGPGNETRPYNVSVTYLIKVA